MNDAIINSFAVRFQMGNAKRCFMSSTLILFSMYPDIIESQFPFVPLRTHKRTFLICYGKRIDVLCFRIKSCIDRLSHAMCHNQISLKIDFKYLALAKIIQSSFANPLICDLFLIRLFSSGKLNF